MILGNDIPNNNLSSVLPYSESIKMSIRNLIFLNRLDILNYDPTKGIGLNKYIGQPLDNITVYNIESTIKRTLSINETRINQLNINVIYNVEYNGINIYITYREKLTGAAQELVLNYEI